MNGYSNLVKLPVGKDGADLNASSSLTEFQKETGVTVAGQIMAFNKRPSGIPPDSSETVKLIDKFTPCPNL